MDDWNENVRRQSESEKLNGCGKKEAYGYGWRHIITLMVFIGFIHSFTLRVGLNVGLVAMVNHTALKRDNGDKYLALMGGDSNDSTSQQIAWTVCGANTDNSSEKPFLDGPYEWDEQLQGVILAAFFYGYIVTQIPGGFCAGYFGAKWVLGMGSLWSAFLTLLMPTAARLGPEYLIAFRGIIWPSVQALFANWAPPGERSQLPAFAGSGCLFGTLVAFILSSIIADSALKWPAIFYIFGSGAMCWVVLWLILSASSPEKHRWISEEEKDYIVSSLKAEGQTRRPSFGDIKWGEVAKSLPLWAAIISHFTFNWCLYVLLTGLPIYFKDVLGFNIKSNGLSSALPYLCQGIVQIASGKVADILRTRYHISTTRVRKLFDCLGHLLPAIFVISVGYVGCDWRAAVALLIIAVGCSGLCGGGFIFNFLDLAPQYSSVLFGISNTFSTVPGIIGPLVTGALIKGAMGVDAIYAWRKVFFIAGTMYSFSTIFYFIFAKGDVQPWAKVEPKKSPPPKELKV